MTYVRSYGVAQYFRRHAIERLVSDYKLELPATDW